MQYFTIFTLSLLAGVTSGAVLDRAAKCNADDCYRVMTNTPLVASQFCSTFIQSTTIITVTPTVTVSGTQTISPTSIPTSITAQLVPSHISQQCVLSTITPLVTRLSSACSCISALPTKAFTVTSTEVAVPTTTTLPPLAPTNIIVNGDFETGQLSPWFVYGSTGGDSEAIAEATDDVANGGQWMLQLQSNFYETWQAPCGASVGQVMQTVPGTLYNVAFDFYFAGGGDNYMALYINNEAPLVTYTTGWNDWIHVTTSFVAQTTSDQLNIQFYSTQWGIGGYYFDNIVVTPA